MTTHIIPPDVKIAAKRAFTRTTFQAYAATLATSVSASAIVSLIRGEVDVVMVVVTVGLALVAPLLSGLRAYLNISAQGIPNEYQPQVVETPEVAPDIPPGDGEHRAEPEGEF